MRRRSFVLTAALVTGLALGIIIAPTAWSSIASAQTETPTPSASPLSNLRDAFLNKLAAALNIQRSQLDTAMTTAGNGTVDEAVQQGTLTQEQGDQLRERIANGNWGSLWGGRGGKGRMALQVAGLRDAMLDAAANTLGITRDELTTQLRSGQTLAQLATAHNTTEQAVVDSSLAAAKTKLDEAVAAGALTQAQADTIYTRLQTAGANLLNHGPGGRGGHRHGPDADDDSATPPAPAPDADTGNA